jgi:glycosyltransferase involved in cell wall biosynthesis
MEYTVIGKNSNMEKIEFIIPTYDRTNHLMCLLNSLCAQTSDNWVAHVIADAPPKGILDKIIKYFKDDDRIRFTILTERHNDWGHTPRNIGLELANEKWVVMTGEDNYYIPKFVELFLDAALKSKDPTFIFCDMVHNWVNFDYIHVKSEIKYGKIDIGNFITKTEFAKQIKLDPTFAQSDWRFIVEYLNKFKGNVIHIPKTLYVHN